MAIDPMFVLGPSLEMYFVDKDSGLPMAGGMVYFYENNTGILKPVYTIVAAGNDFNYVVLPNPSILSSVGTFQDAAGNNILPYYYPFEGLPSDSPRSDVTQLYQIIVYNAAGVLQFTRVGFPNFSSEDVIVNPEGTENFIPNGQFLLHNNIPASTANGFVAGQVSALVTNIAQGGWTFERSTNSGVVDNITFPRYGSYTASPTGNPRYAVQIQTTTPGSTARRDLCIKFRNVNTFASDSQYYDFYFEAEGINGGDITGVQIILRKYFGSGGSDATEVVLNTITLSNNAIMSFNTPILFGNNVGQTIGPNEDDYVQICIRLPLASSQTALFTDFALVLNATALTSFPQQTEAQQIAPSTAGWLPEPNADGSSLYLPTVLTMQGMTFDASDIGTIEADGNLSNYTGSISKIGNKLLADGSQYRYSDYSPLGIPYSRLGNYYIAGGTSGVPQYGTGLNYATAYIETVTTQNLIFTLNNLGVQTAPADGGTPTTFTFTPIVAGVATPAYNFTGYTNGSTLVTAIGNVVGAALASPSAGTSGMTVVSVKNNSLLYQVIQITALSGTALGNGSGTGKYFQFSNTTTTYFMWFSTGAEGIPSGSGTPIKVSINVGMSATDVARVIANAMAGNQIYEIVAKAQTAFVAGAYWTFTANSQLYAVYYVVNGVGTAPALGSSYIYIPVAIATAATNTAVATATQLALNGTYFSVPNLQGLFLRGYDPTGIWDIDFASRLGPGGLIGTGPGTLETDIFQTHIHTFAGTLNRTISSTGSDAYDTAGGAFSNTTSTGGDETRPVNFSVVWAIKY